MQGNCKLYFETDWSYFILMQDFDVSVVCWVFVVLIYRACYMLQLIQMVAVFRRLFSGTAILECVLTSALKFRIAQHVKPFQISNSGFWLDAGPFQRAKLTKYSYEDHIEFSSVCWLFSTSLNFATNQKIPRSEMYMCIPVHALT